jgi:hypothetical protein
MQVDDSTPITYTASRQMESDNVERPPAIKYTDQFLPLPGHICIIDSYDEPAPWYRRLTDRIAAWLVKRFC